MPFVLRVEEVEFLTVESGVGYGLCYVPSTSRRLELLNFLAEQDLMVDSAFMLSAYVTAS